MVTTENFLWRGDRLSLNPASLDDVSGIVALHRADLQAPSPDTAQAWFSLGGPWMHEFYCKQHLQVYSNLGWDCWVVVRNQGEIIGNVEICYSQEPEPFGRYGHLELLELNAKFSGDAIEDWILDQCEKRASARGYTRFWCRPEGSGGSRQLLEHRGYIEVWRNAWLTISALDRVQPPPFHEFRLKGEYDQEAVHLLALGHRESAEYRWRYLWRPVLTPDASDFPTDVRLSGRQITIQGGPSSICLVSIQNWSNLLSASADLWVDQDMTNNAEHISGLIAVAGKQALSMGVDTLEVVIPDSISAMIQERFRAEFRPLGAGDPWFLKLLPPS